MMLPPAGLGRDRNKVKASKWGFYITANPQNSLKHMREVASRFRAVRRGGSETLVVEKQGGSSNRVEVVWPQAVCCDSCVRFLRQALGAHWRNFASLPAAVPDAHQTAATAQEGEVAAESAEEESLEVALEAAVSQRASSSASGPVRPRPPAASTSTSGTLASIAATVEARSDVNLLALKLETITHLYGDGERNRYEELQQPYTVNWEAELGEGTFGKVYVGAKGPAAGDHGHECQGRFAIKMTKDKDDVPKGCHAEAVSAADVEVRRHVAPGSHKNVVRLVDVGLFRRSPHHRPGWNSSSVHIGLVFDMYEIDVRQFLKKSSFTQSGMRHVLNSVLEGLRFMHDRGVVHCDLKPANIFMRGAMQMRGCFARLQQHRVWDAGVPSLDSRTRFQYQVPNSFEVPGEGKS